MIDADRDFVESNFSSGLKESRTIPLVLMNEWNEDFKPIIVKALRRPGVETIVAAGEALHGFITFTRPDFVYFVFVAGVSRGQGLARTLFAAAQIDPDGYFEYGCQTRASWEAVEIRGKAPHARYNPYRGRFINFDVSRDKSRPRW